MGMSASQVRLLQLTERKNDIGYELTMLSNDKVSLTRDMQRVAREYQNALNSQTLKWSNNGGVSYIDLSYSNLMSPSSINQNKAYLLTDLNNKVVVNSQYQKYAAMVSPDGKPGGDWESVRTQVLSELTGIDPAKIENLNSYQEAVWKSQSELDKLNSRKIDVPKRNSSVGSFVDKAGSVNGYDIGDLYSSGGTVNLGTGATAVQNLESLINGITTNLSKYLEYPEYLEKASAAYFKEYKGLIENPNIDVSKGDSALKVNNNNYSINVAKMIDTIISKYAYNGGNVSKESMSNLTTIEWLDIESSTYQNKVAENEKWEADHKAATDAYNNAVSEKNKLLTASEESMLDFYDSIFSSIADNGWTYTEQVNDNDYLNDMLQNNMYMITTVDRNSEYNKNGDEYMFVNEYESDIATNHTNIFKVNDSDAREEALIEYEYEKGIISAKEAKIDARMQDLQTEQAAVSQMIQSIEQVKNDNVDRTFNIFS